MSTTTLADDPEGKRDAQVLPHTVAAADSPATDVDLDDLAGTPGRGEDIFSGLGVVGFGAPARDALAELLSPAPTGVRPTGLAPGPLTEGAAQPESGVLAELHAEYFRVMHDSSLLAAQTVWEGGETSVGEEPPTLAQWQRKARAYRSLNDLMMPPLGIDALIVRFEPLDGVALFEREKQIDVLHLFAVDQLRNRPKAIACLTRAEHHATALDSPIHIGHRQTQPKESS